MVLLNINLKDVIGKFYLWCLQFYYLKVIWNCCCEIGGIRKIKKKVLYIVYLKVIY